MTTLKYIALLILISPLSTLTWGENIQPIKGYKFGVNPYLSVTRMDNMYAPISNELEKNLNHKVKFLTSSTHHKFLEKLNAEYYDIVLIQPFWYPIAVDEKGYIPLLRMEEPFVSSIITLENSEIRSVDDLKGKIIATPPPFAPVVHMAKRALLEKGIVPGKDVTFVAFKTVDSCLQQVLIGSANACISPPYVPTMLEQSMNIKLRTVLQSSSIPNMALVVHPRVAEKERDTIKKTFLSLSNTEAGKKLLKNIQSRGFIPIIDSQYDVVRDFRKEIKLKEATLKETKLKEIGHQ